MCRISALLLLTLMLISLGSVPSARAQQGERCFTETGYCISRRIRQFWEQNGGLPVFGLPLTPLREEQIEGKPVQVQWFERNRLDLHPENTAPYDVLIGLVGVERLAQQGRDWRSFPSDNGEGGQSCRYFPETGHAVCGAVLQVWRANGLDLDGGRGVSEAESMALFGMPISSLLIEPLGDGREYVVQWFERGRFEIHPELAPPHNVLLGLLGSELRASAAFEGVWSGTTSDGGTLTFVIRGSTVDSYHWRSGHSHGCGDEPFDITYPDANIPIQGTSFNEEIGTDHFRGMFSSPRAASGSFSFQPHKCENILVSWSASR